MPTSDEFACPRCGGPSVRFPAALDDDYAHLTCGHCGALLGTLRDFRRRMNRPPAFRCSGLSLSAC